MPCGTKVTDGLSLGTTTYQVFNDAGTVTGSGSYSGQLTGGTYLMSKGQCTPRYNALVRQGKLIPYTQWIQDEFMVLDRSAHPGRIKKTTSQKGDYFSDWVSGGRTSSYYAPSRTSSNDKVLAVSPSPSYLLNQAAASAYSSHSFDVGTFLGELPETLRMLGKTVQRFSDIKQRKFKKLKNFDPHSFLLEARYGWSPMYRDLKSLHRQFLRQKRSITRVVGRSQASASTSDSDSSTGGDAIRSINYAWSDDIQITSMASVAADYAHSAWKLNPIATGYELIPYSFVVDWFWNLSQAIRASSLLLGSSQLTACAGLKIQTTRTFTLTATALSGYTYTTSPNGSCSSTAIVTERYPTSVPYLPPIKVNLDGNKIADLIAMIAGLKAVKTALGVTRSLAR